MEMSGWAEHLVALQISAGMVVLGFIFAQHKNLSAPQKKQSGGVMVVILSNASIRREGFFTIPFEN